MIGSPLEDRLASIQRYWSKFRWDGRCCMPGWYFTTDHPCPHGDGTHSRQFHGPFDTKDAARVAAGEYN